MRIITGIYKGRNLFMVPGKTTRPTTSYNREVIFSVYQDYEDCRVLDLYAGTGSFGLEALSRGAKWVDFVEFATPAMGTILKNIGHLGCKDSCHLWRKKVDAFLKDCPDTYDVIFLDQPYEKNLINPALQQIKERDLLNPDGIIVVEHSPKERLTDDLLAHVIQDKGNKITHFSWLQW